MLERVREDLVPDWTSNNERRHRLIRKVSQERSGGAAPEGGEPFSGDCLRVNVIESQWAMESIYANELMLGLEDELDTLQRGGNDLGDPDYQVRPSVVFQNVLHFIR